VLNVKHCSSSAATDGRRASSSTYTVKMVSPAATGSPTDYGRHQEGGFVADSAGGMLIHLDAGQAGEGEHAA